MNKLKLLLLAVISAALVAAGCSGGDDNNSLFNAFGKDSSLSSDISVSESSADPSAASSQPSEVLSSVDQSSQGSSQEPSQESSQEPSQESSGEESSDPEESGTPFPEAGEIYKTEYKHFYPKLTELEKEDFKALYVSAQGFQESAVFPAPISSDELEKLMWLLNYDCPELIHVTGDYMPSYTDDGRIISVKLYYNMESSEYENCFSAIADYFDQLRAETADMDEQTKELYVFRRLFSETVFTETTERAGSVYGVLIEHGGRCEGMSKSFAWCMNEIGIECMTVAGHPYWDNDNLYSSHSWNIVKICGEYYHVDLAADNVKYYPDDTPLPLYSFFNAYDRWILSTRDIYDYFTDLGVPDCTAEELNYHVLSDSLITSQDDPEKKFKEIIVRSYNDGTENAVSIRFEDKDDYDSFFSTRDDWLEDIRTEYGYKFTSSFYSNDVGLTVIIQFFPDREQITD